MNNTIYNIDLTRMLPPSLKEDENMLALANAIQEELLETAKMARLANIYGRIDELPEEILDILAYDLHVDWYDYSYPLEVKRELIKTSTKVHKRLGTKYAVETALGALHPNSNTEEWFEYGGEPFSFRIVLDTTNSRVTADPLEITKAVDMYKRMTAHMDDIIYQCSIGLEVEVKTKKDRYKTKMAGKTTTGTHPQREVIGGVENVEIDLENQIKGYGFKSKLAGTTPRRSMMAELVERDLELDPTIKDFSFNSTLPGKNNAGENPQRQTKGSNEDLNLEAENRLDPFYFKSRLTGTGSQRNIDANLKSKQIIPEVTVEGYKYKYKFCGTILARSK